MTTSPIWMYAIGFVAQLLFTLEVQTALAGSLLGIDPFDQPGVEAGKKITQKNLAARQLQPV
jgi:glucose-6-phosphate isomerase